MSQSSEDDSFAFGLSGNISHQHQIPQNPLPYDFSLVLGIRSSHPPHLPPSPPAPSTSYSHTSLEPSLCRPPSRPISDRHSPERTPGLMSHLLANNRNQDSYSYSNMSAQQHFGARFELGGASELACLPPAAYNTLGGVQPPLRYPSMSPQNLVYHQHQHPEFLGNVPPQYPTNNHGYVPDTWDYQIPNSQSASSHASRLPAQGSMYSQMPPPQNPASSSNAIGHRPSTSFSGLIDPNTQHRRALSLGSASPPNNLDIRTRGNFSVGEPSFTQASSTPWMSGSFDLSTGLFSRSSEHPRLRTAQACEKCRLRKAKCSGDHPSCQRCVSRGLICEYAPERKMRGPNKPKPGKGKSLDDSTAVNSRTEYSDRANGVAKRKPSDIARCGSDPVKTESVEDFRTIQVFGTTLKKKSRPPPLHFGLTSNVYHGSDAMATPGRQRNMPLNTTSPSPSLFSVPTSTHIPAAHRAYTQHQDFSPKYNRHMRSDSGSGGTGTPTSSSSPVTPASGESGSGAWNRGKEFEVGMPVSGAEAVAESWVGSGGYRAKADGENGEFNHREERESASRLTV